jgi:hypothetical protein
MDPFAVIIFGGVAGLLISLLLIGRFTPGSGAKELDWHPARSMEQEVQNEIDDLDQMLAATNRRRAARGERPLTEADLHDRVSADTRLLLGRAGEPDEEIRQVLDAKNRRRRERGEPELTYDEFRASLGGES